jgi:hypothetical protein
MMIVWYTSFVWELRNLLTKILPSAGKKDTWKCIEGRRKSMTTSRRWKSSFLPNNGTTGDLLECNCRCYLCDANDRENDGPGGPQPPSWTFHYGPTTDRHLRRIVQWRHIVSSNKRPLISCACNILNDLIPSGNVRRGKSRSLWWRHWRETRLATRPSRKSRGVPESIPYRACSI